MIQLPAGLGIPDECNKREPARKPTKYLSQMTKKDKRSEIAPVTGMPLPGVGVSAGHI